MDKRKLKSELKNIVEVIGNYIENIEKFDEEFMTGIEDKIDELHWLLEKHCLVPDSFDPEKIKFPCLKSVYLGMNFGYQTNELDRIIKALSNKTRKIELYFYTPSHSEFSLKKRRIEY